MRRAGSLGVGFALLVLALATGLWLGAHAAAGAKDRDRAAERKCAYLNTPDSADPPGRQDCLNREREQAGLNPIDVIIPGTIGVLGLWFIGVGLRRS